MTDDIRRARVTVLGSVSAGEGAPDLMREEYYGTYRDTGRGLVLEYDEPDMRAHVKLTCTPDCALLERTGQTSSRMEFAPGCARRALYALAEGEFDLTVECAALALSRSATHGRLRLAYRLTSNGAPLSDNRLTVSYRLC